jgi:hypothetical protein
MANWSLWSGCLFAIATAIAGWLAYNSVAHDSASHAAMTLHRNWALPTASTAASTEFTMVMIEKVKNKKPGRPSFLAIKIAHKPNNKKAGSCYFCESLFWASQPKQAAKT